ncbi:hypothetical protein BT93_I1772 [Corymbia citriodora subsp. variegata]|nr:hypothetical protein BT93_I1772 [Corymbia citriodora subsp. variegata]
MIAERNVGKWIHGAKPVILTVVVQAAFAGVNVVYKLAANDGMKLRIIVASVSSPPPPSSLLSPSSLKGDSNNKCSRTYCQQLKKRPKLTGMVLFHAFCCGLFGGSLVQNLHLESLALTSTTYATAMANLGPAITYIMAVFFGLERVVIGRIEGKAKVLRTLMGIGGAMVLTFYKGFEIQMWSTHVNLLHYGHQSLPANHHPAFLSSAKHGAHVQGPLFTIGSCIFFSLWLIIQTKMAKRYPCHYSSTALISFFGSIQAVGFARCTERDWSEWKLGWNVSLLTVAYSRGSVLASIFNPLMLVLVALAGSFLLDEKLHLGSLLGAGLVVCGLYVVP